MYKSILILLLAVCIVMPAVSSAAATRSEILAEIARLLKVVDTLKSQMRAIGINPDGVTNTVEKVNSCLPVTRALQSGTSGSDVYSLQGFLIEQGVLGEEYSTGFYGAITKEAVARWQLLSHLPASGSVDKQTADAMKIACTSGVSVIQARPTQGTSTTIPRLITTTPGVTPGIDNFSFTIEPTSGYAPHAVSAFFAINGTTCTAYALDWGDGTTAVTREGGFSNCETDQINRQLTHQYQTRGNYNVVFRTGRGYLSQAPVVTQKTITVQ